MYQPWNVVLFLVVDARERSEWSDAVAAQIRVERAERGWDKQTAASRAGIPRVTFLRLDNGSRVADTSQLSKMCSAFGIPMSEFFRRVEERVERGLADT